MFLLLCFVYKVIIELKTEGQTIYRLLNSNQNSTFSALNNPAQELRF